MIIGTVWFGRNAMKVNKQVIKKYMVIAVRCIIAYCTVIGIVYYFFKGDNIIRESFLNYMLFVMIYILIKKSEKIPFRIKMISVIFSILYAVTTVFGRALYDTDGFEILYKDIYRIGMGIAEIISFVIIVSLFLMNVFIKLQKYQSKLQKSKRKSWRELLLWWGIFFVSYIPCLLAYYPGMYTYDIPNQNYQAMGLWSYNKFHPPLHTYLWSLCLKYSKFFQIEAVTLYAFGQMLVIALFFATLIVYFRSRDYLVFIITVIYYLFNPIFAIISLMITKDVLFGVFFGWTVILVCDILTYDMISYQKGIKIILLILCMLFSCLFRNNVVYVFIVYIPFVIIFFRKNKKYILISSICSLIIFYLISGPVMKMLNIQEGNNREMLSVPIQQISLVVVKHSNDIDKNTRDKIDQYVSYKELKKLYNPRFADPIKSTFRTDDYNKDKVAFFKLWIELGKKYPKEYILAFLDLNLPYWFIDAHSIDEYSKREYIETNIKYDENYRIERKSKLPQLYDFYQKIADYSIMQKFPLIANLFSIAMPIWVMLFSSVILILKRRYKYLLVILLPMLLWATYLLGPVSNSRYIWPLMMIYPVFLFLILGNEDIELD